MAWCKSRTDNWVCAENAYSVRGSWVMEGRTERKCSFHFLATREKFPMPSGNALVWAMFAQWLPMIIISYPHRQCITPDCFLRLSPPAMRHLDFEMAILLFGDKKSTKVAWKHDMPWELAFGSGMESFSARVPWCQPWIPYPKQQLPFWLHSISLIGSRSTQAMWSQNNHCCQTCLCVAPWQYAHRTAFRNHIQFKLMWYCNSMNHSRYISERSGLLS